MTGKERIIRTLEFQNTDGVVPRDLWVLPWIEEKYPQEMQQIKEDFPSHIQTVSDISYLIAPSVQGDPYKKGTYIDEWGCVFQNVHDGIIGEVKQAIVPGEDEEWEDFSKVHIPRELLSFSVEAVNQWCLQHTDSFIKAGCCPRPFEQLQFIRGTENLFIDFMEQPDGMLEFLSQMHGFYCELLTKWCKTDVDAIMFMDDWGSQNSLLIAPELWRKMFKPLYKDYIAIAKQYGKKTMMHSDGYILDIIPDLIEIGLDMLNCQVFCMGLEKLAPFAGKITFWGEIDRQWILPKGSKEEVEDAVKNLRKYLYQDGGLVMQLEAGPGATVENIRTVYETNEKLNG